MLLRAILPVLLLSFSASAMSAEVTVRLPGADCVQRKVVTYRCEGFGALEVEYINAGGNALAVVPVEGRTLIFANVISASGARYAAGRYVWWTKGDRADLYDVTKGETAKPVGCRAEQGRPESRG